MPRAIQIATKRTIKSPITGIPWRLNRLWAQSKGIVYVSVAGAMARAMVIAVAAAVAWPAATAVVVGAHGHLAARALSIWEPL